MVKPTATRRYGKANQIFANNAILHLLWQYIWKLTVVIDRHLANDVTLLLLLGVIWGSLSWANHLAIILAIHMKNHPGDRSSSCKLCDFALIFANNLRKPIEAYHPVFENANREVTRSGEPTSLILTSWTLQLSRKGGNLNKILVFFVVWISLIIFI